VGIGAGSGRLEPMRGPCLSIALLACACSSAHPSPEGNAPQACDVLPLVGRATPSALAADEAGGIALAGNSRGPQLRSGSARLEAPGGFVLRADAAGRVGWIHGLSGAQPLGAAVEADGSVVVVGQAQRQCFAARLAGADGKEMWTSRLTAAGESTCRAVAIDPRNGDLWAAGEFSGSLGPARSAGLTDALVLKIAVASGEMRLARTFGSKGTDTATAIAVTATGDAIVAGSFGGDVDASVAEIDFGRGAVRGSGGSDGYLVALSPEGGTRWFAVAGEYGDDEMIAVGARGGAVFAASNAHRDRRGAQCGGHMLILRRGEFVRVMEDDCSSARAAAFDEWGRFWTLENSGKALRARAFGARDGEPLGYRIWEGERTSLQAGGIARVPGGLAAAGITDGEAIICGKPVGSLGEPAAFVVWIRDLAP